MPDQLSITPVTEADFEEWLAMGLELWPDHPEGELRAIFRELMASPKEEDFIGRTPDGNAVGFLNLSTRTDYVEGTETSPVGYIEGIFVKEHLRKSGVGRAMVSFAERWAAAKGYTELASDAELDNVDSHRFHASVGFREGGRIVAFVKDVGPGTD
jgi:aminoglycoside 6'-N-acetyltransferase I